MYRGSAESFAQSSIRSYTRYSTYRGSTRSSTYKGFTRSSTYRGSTRSSMYKGSAQSSTRSSARSSMYKGFARSSAQSSIRSSARSSTYGGSTRNSASGPRYIPDTAMFTTSFHQIRCAHLISLQSPPTIHSNYSEQRPRRTTKGVRYNYYVQLVQCLVKSVQVEATQKM